MAKLTNKFANVLGTLGVKKGDRVFVFMDRIPELYAAAFGTLKAGCVLGPLFAAFGPDAIKDRLEDAGREGARHAARPSRRSREMRPNLPALKHVIIVDHGKRPETGERASCAGTISDPASEEFETVKTGLEDFAIMHYTSGTTGKPKGAAHVHKAVLGHYATGKYVLDFHDRRHLLVHGRSRAG